MKRTITGVVIFLLGIVLCVLRGFFMRGALWIMAALCIYESYEAYDKKGMHPFRWGGYLFALLSMPIYYLVPSSFSAMGLLLLFCVMIGIVPIVLRGSVDFEAMVASVLPIIYPGCFAVGLYTLQDVGDVFYSTAALVAAFTIAWLGDVCAMVVGVRYGKHRLSPAISPKKSIEGSIAGLIGSLIAAVATPLVIGAIANGLPNVEPPSVPFPPLWAFALLGLLAGAAAQLGDLAASLVKRHCGIKDYGSIFPGHGGMMDRMDGVLFSACVCSVFFLIGTI